MGGDLNLKKSWHPSLMSNQKKVWEEEKRALDERKKIDQIRKEREEERQIQELQDLQEAAGGKKRLSRVDWMYQGPSAGQTSTTEENEAFLLGKRRVDTLLQGKEKETLKKESSQDAFMALQNANTAKDTASKIRDDPLLAIKKQEQAAYEAMMSDPVKRRMLLKAAGREEEPDRERERKRRKHHHHHHSSRHHHDRDSEYRSRHRSSHDDSRDRYSQLKRRQRTDRSVSTSRSPSPERTRRRQDSPRRSWRSESPDPRERSRSPYRQSQERKTLHSSRSWHGSRQRTRSRSKSPARRQSSTGHDDHRAAKLAAMQQDASDLDLQRQNRLRNIAEQERNAAEQEDKARARNARYGSGRADFVNGFHKRAGDLSLSNRMGRQRYAARGDDE